MSTKEVTHERKRATIKKLVLEGGATKYDSINKAKKASRELQKGGAVVRVVK